MQLGGSVWASVSHHNDHTMPPSSYSCSSTPSPMNHSAALPDQDFLETSPTKSQVSKLNETIIFIYVQIRKLVFKFLEIDGFVNLTYLKPYRKFKTYPYCPCCPPKLHSWCSWCFPHRCRLKGTTTRSLQCNAPSYHHRVILDSTLYNFVQPHGWHFLVSFQSFIDNCYTFIVTCFLPESNVL